MAETRLAIPRLEVTMDDGSTFVVQALNPDLLRYDRTAAKHGWPSPTEAPFLWLTFLAWSAGRRTGDVDEALTWESFSNVRCAQVRNLTDQPSTNGKVDDAGDADAAVPIQPEAAPG